MQVHHNCHIKTMSYAVKRQGEIKSFQFLLEGSCADFLSDVSRESVPCGRARKRERSLTEFCSKAWYVIQSVDRRRLVDLAEVGSTMSARYMSHSQVLGLRAVKQIRATGNISSNGHWSHLDNYLISSTGTLCSINSLCGSQLPQKLTVYLNISGQKKITN